MKVIIDKPPRKLTMNEIYYKSFKHDLLETLLDNALFLTYDDEEEKAEGRELICNVLKMTESEVEVLGQLYSDGPLHDGDVVSKTGRDGLLRLELASKAVIKGEDGFQVLNYKGGSAWRLVSGGARSIFNQSKVPYEKGRYLFELEDLFKD